MIIIDAHAKVIGEQLLPKTAIEKLSQGRNQFHGMSQPGKRWDRFGKAPDNLQDSTRGIGLVQ